MAGDLIHSTEYRYHHFTGHVITKAANGYTELSVAVSKPYPLLFRQFWDSLLVDRLSCLFV